MSQISPKIIFFGTEDYSLSSLEALVEAGFNVVAAITKPDAPRGRGQTLTEPPVKTFAKNHNIAVWQPTKLKDIEDEIRKLQPVTGVLVAYGKIIPKSTIDLFTPGIINLHPSLLPHWRGPSPIEAAIANQDQETGVSIMQLDVKMDAGPVYIQESIALSGCETKPELYNRLFSLGNKLLVDNLNRITSGNLLPKDQDDTNATYCQLLSKANSQLSPSTMTAAEIDAHIRAHLGFPRSRMNILGSSIIVTKAHVNDTSSGHASIKCQDNKFITIDEVIAPSGKTMKFEDYLRGYAK